MKEGPIFVVGAPRSGTTLLQRMLRSHPRIASPTGESHFMIPLLRDHARYGDLSKRENLVSLLRYMHGRWAEFLDTDMRGIAFDTETTADAIAARRASGMAEVIDTLFSLNAEGQGKQRWLEKTPYYTLHIDLLAATYPDAQFVHIIRDGRDAVLSMLERAVDIRVFNVDAGARLWQRYVESGREAGKKLSDSRYHEIRYEDMLGNPLQSVQTLCAFLDEPFSNDVIDFQTSRAAKTKIPLLKKPLQKDNAEKWRERMTPSQLRTFESVAGNTLEAFGYPLNAPVRRQPQLEKLVLELHQRISSRLNPHPKSGDKSRKSQPKGHQET